MRWRLLAARSRSNPSAPWLALLLLATRKSEAAQMQVGWFTHVPKTGGSTIYQLLEGRETKCRITSSCKVSVGPRGAWVITPSQLHGLGATQRLWDSCCNGACDLSSAQVSGTGLAHACSNGGYGWSQPNMSSLRDKCPYNLHWQVRISQEFARLVSRAGGRPVVVAGVRSPFGYYVSHYFYALQRQQQNNLTGAGGGLPPFGFEHAVCLQNRNSESCRTMFLTHLQQRIDSSRGFESFMNQFVGNIQTRTTLVPSWAWVRLEVIGQDFPRVYTRITGLPYPVRECPLTQISAARCYGEYYDAAAPGLLDRVREHDSWTFSYFDYPRVPGATCLPRGGTLAAGHSTLVLEARNGTDRAPLT